MLADSSNPVHRDLFPEGWEYTKDVLPLDIHTSDAGIQRVQEYFSSWETSSAELVSNIGNVEHLILFCGLLLRDMTTAQFAQTDPDAGWPSELPFYLCDTNWSMEWEDRIKGHLAEVLSDLAFSPAHMVFRSPIIGAGPSNSSGGQSKTKGGPNTPALGTSTPQPVPSNIVTSGQDHPTDTNPKSMASAAAGAAQSDVQPKGKTGPQPRQPRRNKPALKTPSILVPKGPLHGEQRHLTDSNIHEATPTGPTASGPTASGPTQPGPTSSDVTASLRTGTSDVQSEEQNDADTGRHSRRLEGKPRVNWGKGGTKVVGDPTAIATNRQAIKGKTSMKPSTVKGKKGAK